MKDSTSAASPLLEHLQEAGLQLEVEKNIDSIDSDYDSKKCWAWLYSFTLRRLGTCPDQFLKLTILSDYIA